MPRPDTAIVVTTIFEPVFLRGYIDNLRRYGRLDTVRVIVIPDRKTPPSVMAACHEAAAGGADVLCPSLDEQSAFLQRLSVDPTWIPFDSDNRRNVGFLLALEAGCDRVISIDDDNFCPESADFVGTHSVAGASATLPVRSTSDGWINLCSELTFAAPHPLPYPRGFPYARRNDERQVTSTTATVNVALNAGLWIDDPDVDAITRLVQRPNAVEYAGQPFALDAATWSPINTQNTALSRQAMAAYYYVRMGFELQGLKIDRYGDILSGYFVQKCIRHAGQAVRVGDPVCRHVRTPHNLFKDLYHELAGMVLIEELVPWLQQLRLSGSTYAESYACLADELHAVADQFTGFVFDQGGRAFLSSTSRNMNTWLCAVRAIGL